MHWKRAEDLGRFEKVSLLSWELDSEWEGSTFGARRSQTNLRATGTAWDRGGGRWKSQNRKNVYLSPYVKEPLHSKVIKKKFCTWTKKSSSFFSCFGIPMFYGYMLWTLYVRFTHSHIMTTVQREHTFYFFEVKLFMALLLQWERTLFKQSV